MLMTLFGLIFFIAWIVALVDLVGGVNQNGCLYTLIWLMLITFIPIVGTLLYFVLRNRNIYD